MREFATRLKQERELRMWSQELLAEKIDTTAPTVSRWECGSTFPGLHFRQKLSELFNKSPEELGFTIISADNQGKQSPGQPAEDMQAPPVVPAISVTSAESSTLSSCWNVPHRRNPFFTGRDEILAGLYKLLHEKQRAALTQTLQVQALSGLGGIGKTQTALEYAYLFRADYQAVLWAQAETHDVLTGEFVQLAEILHLPEKDEQDHRRVVEAVKRWLSRHNRWLLILDNVEDLSIVDDFTPADGQGHILLTTRAQSTGSYAYRIDLDQMTPDEGACFLLRRTSYIERDAALEQASAADRETAREISLLMDGLPLALNQAGAYIEETGCSLSDYLVRYQQRRFTLLNQYGPGTPQGNVHPLSVSATFGISFERIEQANPAAAEFLRLCAFLPPDAILEEIVIAGASELTPLLRILAEDPLQLDAALAELRRHSLLRRRPGTAALTIHRLVQAVFKDRMDETTHRQWADRTVRTINQLFPHSDEIGTWSRCQRYLPHALLCASLIEEWEIRSRAAGQLLIKLGSYLQRHAQYDQAKVFFLKALYVLEKVVGPEHPLVADSLNGVAEIHYLQGEYSQGEQFLRRALAIREQVLGSEHVDVAESLNDLALFCCAQGKYDQAEAIYQRALAIWERVLGTVHPHIAACLNNFALLYRLQAQFDRAEPLQRRALTIVQQIQEPGHPDIAIGLSNLGSIYLEQNKYAQAESLLRQALTIIEQAFGAVHPHAASTLNSLAVLYMRQGQYSQAEEFFHRALESV